MSAPGPEPRRQCRGLESAEGTSAAAIPPLARYDAEARVAFTGVGSRLVGLHMQSPLRFLLPDPERDDATAVVVANTAGGVVGGDRLALAIEAGDGARVVAIGQAAEKVYRSGGETARITCRYRSRGAAQLEVVPQGTILFDGARLARRTTLVSEDGGVLLYGEILHFGRTAMRERFSTGRLVDRTEIERDGERLATDALRIEGDLAAIAASRAGLANAQGTAVAWLLHPEADRFLAALRERAAASEAPGVRAAVGRFDAGLLVVRWLAGDGASLRRSFGSVFSHLRSSVLERPAKMPRIWSI